MFLLPSWVLFTVAAAGAQTLRNAMQRDLIHTIGTAGATYVRFLFGLPFAVAFLLLACVATGRPPNPLNLAALAWTGVGGVAQILATGLMLAAMRERSFVVTTAYTKTEPVQVALFGLIALGDRVTGAGALAILVATAGVILMSWPARSAKPLAAGEAAGWRPAMLGLGAAACFALSSVGFRAGILAMGGPTFFVAASTILAAGLCIQSTLIVAHLALFDRRLLKSVLAAWRPSLFAGFLGAFASQFWFMAFAIETAARVRTLALIEVVFAQIVSRRIFKQGASAREFVGMGMIIAGVALLLSA
ncbi:DMT family transporter [Methylocapsa polymorpha]|uniref:DMT family transporter n=1 Tax=Methylocapsa polymorpha TaxID=3080828 RepID=A0ABZ0HV16_9HYPH|nr:DMT family transporter [Methylocapsa sp. RX1]